MKRKILWMGLSFLLVAALVLASCGEAAPGEQEEEEEPAVGEPQYGGTLTVGLAFLFSQADPPSPDIADGGRTQLDWLYPIQESPLSGDFVKYGPRGTDEFGWHLRGYNPRKFMKGQLLESWDISEEKVVWHVRPGIYWQGRDVMESRELVAEDIVAWLLYFREAPGGAGFKSYTTGDIYATDKYTLEIEFSDGFNFMLMYEVCYEDRAHVFPPEIQGSKKWDDQVGTGPFMFKEYVVGSHMAYDRNPIWWDTATIDGVEYELPFINKVIVPIIPDPATQIAALRTGMIDWHEQIPAVYWPSLLETAPGIESIRAVAAGGMAVTLNNTKPPFDDVNVRRALMIGTDIEKFIDLIGVDIPLPMDWVPYYPPDTSWYTPLEEWPEDVQILYEYNPTLAKQMLADAGHPDGFSIELVCQTLPQAQDQAAMIKDQWAKIGVEVDINAVDAATFSNLTYDKTYKDALLRGLETADPVVTLVRWRRTDAVLNWPMYSNPEVDALADRAQAEKDFDEQMSLTKEGLAIMRPEVPMVPLSPNVDGHFWWPWLKNYYGERNVGDFTNPWPILAHIWIDQDLKAEMGY